MAWFMGLLFLFFISSSSACDRCIHQSKASHFYETPTSYGGACGYGHLALEFSDGYFAAAVPSLYKQGAGCGACYQVRCKNRRLCTTIGTIVVLTDQSNDNTTDFVMSQKAFVKMALNGKGPELLNLGVIVVEYKRVPCEYRNRNLLVRVEESSDNPFNLAIKFYYQGGQTDMVAVDIAQVGTSEWSHMSRNYGAVWETNNVPEGALQLRMVVTSGYDRKWVWAKSVLPANWKSGMIYDTGVQINDIAKESCPPWQCGDKPWN